MHTRDTPGVLTEITVTHQSTYLAFESKYFNY